MKREVGMTKHAGSAGDAKRTDPTDFIHVILQKKM